MNLSCNCKRDHICDYCFINCVCDRCEEFTRGRIIPYCDKCDDVHCGRSEECNMICVSLQIERIDRIENEYWENEQDEYRERIKERMKRLPEDDKCFMCNGDCREKIKYYDQEKPICNACLLFELFKVLHTGRKIEKDKISDFVREIQDNVKNAREESSF